MNLVRNQGKYIIWNILTAFNAETRWVVNSISWATCTRLTRIGIEISTYIAMDLVLGSPRVVTMGHLI